MFFVLFIFVFKVVKYLIGEKAEFDLRNKFGRTALDYASLTKQVDIMQYLKSLESI